MIPILIAYMGGMTRMLEVSMQAFQRHDAGAEYEIWLLTDVNDPEAVKEAEKYSDIAKIKTYDIGVAGSDSGQHGRLLDSASKEVAWRWFMTMDSDCFPVADGWLSDLLEMQNDAVVTGILWPWINNGKYHPQSLIGRVLDYHNTKNTQPSCQLILTSVFREIGAKFAGSGGDTNAGFMKDLHVHGYSTAGWNVTRGAFSDGGEMDPEMNRYEALIFGDKIYHHVGASRDFKKSTQSLFSKTKDRVYNEFGAEWMLEEGNSHVFKFDREDEAVDFKMNMMIGLMKLHLETNDNLLGKWN